MLQQEEYSKAMSEHSVSTTQLSRLSDNYSSGACTSVFRPTVKCWCTLQLLPAAQLSGARSLPAHRTAPTPSSNVHTFTRSTQV
eukprot:1093616-Pleurochrysis_carterae.AAC.2